MVPFAAAIENGAEMIMTAHIQYPEIEKETYVSTSTGEEVYLPATMSHVILTDILRDELGFEGVVQCNRSMSSKGVVRGLLFQ